MKKRTYLTALIPIILFTLSSCDSLEINRGENDEVGDKTLTFYALNDFHGAYLYDESYSQTGMSRIGNFLINEKKTNPDTTFIISSGDMFQGGAESNITYGKVVIESMNAIGFDSMTVGNHEFDWGDAKLSEMASAMDFPLLGSNVYYVSNGIRPTYLSPYTIIEKGDVKVGIIGTIMPGINSSILATISNDFNFPNELDELKITAKSLKEEKGCDVVILSTHDGDYDSYRDLATYYDDTHLYIDALFLGHDHTKKEGTFNSGVNYIEGGCNGNYLSKITIPLTYQNKEYIVNIKDSNYENMYTFSNSKFSTESSEVNAVYNKYKDSIESIRDEVLCTFTYEVSREEFGTYMSYALLSYVNDEKLLEDKVATLGIMNSGGIRSSIPVGDFTYGDLIKVYPFENVLCVLEVSESDYTYSYLNNDYFYKYIEGVNEGNQYIATIDYVAYYASNLKKIYSFSEILGRDVVANSLKKDGFKRV